MISKYGLLKNKNCLDVEASANGKCNNGCYYLNVFIFTCGNITCLNTSSTSARWNQDSDIPIVSDPFHKNKITFFIA